ncbi:OmpA family protein [Polynucleobacter paneuropaeus]|jgi:OOP family OmpA-OmpF porin|uniref:outer membrane protein OmpA n=1 Tax=Polynucleobacter paneuropaeus TaxID=2527775 RepID=UPI001BFD0F1F|nr:OmpA family protein [Polynucleobacter paneuropaeus]MBT8520846.1 OmpA family protein [Polynucleobacter paneuropaeus]MBT8527705.1 OmpA family protein [Polynucleobacter paneuropaeus]MBT8530176.1 OmpA family protein [Polynucleobacter paneuropaeus]MBT8534318.1 OmpA family protein [Polynucleobacter paneuropaeus]MBT8539790.1 OmpA family protein [Polynucleobacter paneuropaeus]
MNKTLKLLLASVITVSASAAMASDNWQNGDGSLNWKNGDGTLCWRDNAWTPASAAPGCDGALQGGHSAGVSQSKITLQADTLYDFNKSDLKPEGKATLDKIAADLSKIKLEVIIAVGNTDSVGTDAYNMALGQRRAQSVKTYLVAKGIDASRIYTESKGKSNPVASNATEEGRAKNRRTDIEVVGTAK